MSQVFECPNCGGPIDYNGEGATVRCPYCGKSIIVPQELRPTSDDSSTLVINTDTSSTSRQLSGWIVPAIILFVICTVIIPILGAATGLGAAIFGIQQAFTVSQPTFRQTVIAPLLATAVIAPTRKPLPTPSPTPGFASVVIQFGSAGTGPGRLNDARSIAVDNTGRIYVGDYQDGRVQIFDPSGKFLSQFSVGDSNTLLFSLTADRRGIIYAVADGQIQRYDSATGKMLAPLQYSGGDRFANVTTTADNKVLAMWYEQREGLITSIEGHRDDLVQFDADGKLVKVTPGFMSSQTGTFELDTQLAVDGVGNLYALSSNFGPAVFEFSPTGKYITRFGSSGSAPDQFQSPSSIAVDGKSRVYVGDQDRILIFDKNGRFLDTIQLDESPDAMAFNDKDELFVVARSKVLKLDLNDH